MFIKCGNLSIFTGDVFATVGTVGRSERSCAVESAEETGPETLWQFSGIRVVGGGKAAHEWGSWSGRVWFKEEARGKRAILSHHHHHRVGVKRRVFFFDPAAGNGQREREREFSSLVYHLSPIVLSVFFSFHYFYLLSLPALFHALLLPPFSLCLWETKECGVLCTWFDR